MPQLSKQARKRQRQKANRHKKRLLEKEQIAATSLKFEQEKAACAKKLADAINTRRSFRTGQTYQKSKEMFANSDMGGSKKDAMKMLRKLGLGDDYSLQKMQKQAQTGDMEGMIKDASRTLNPEKLKSMFGSKDSLPPSLRDEISDVAPPLSQILSEENLVAPEEMQCTSLPPLSEDDDQDLVPPLLEEDDDMPLLVSSSSSDEDED